MRHTLRLHVALALCTLLSLGFPGPLRADEPAPRVLQHLHASGDFIDDPMALSEDGNQISWITTDGATHAQIHIGPVGDEKAAHAFPYGSITPERVQFLDAQRVLVVERNPTTKLARAEVFGPKGSLGKYGPVTDVGVARIGDVPMLVTWLKATTPNKGTTHTFNAWRLDTLRPHTKKVVLVENAEGRVAFAASLYKPLYFLDGFATLVGQKEGIYDKKKDIRRPEGAARADLFAGKLLGEKEIKDVVAHAEFTSMRKSHTNETNFVRFSEDRSQLVLVTAELMASDAVHVLTVPRPLRKYEPDTLLYRPTPDGNLTVSLTVDPVNAEAVKAQKADKDWLDIYHLDVKSHGLSQLVRIDGEKRPSTWVLSGNRLALLRKHKGFGRGGADLEVLEFGPERPKSAPAKDSASPAKANADSSEPGDKKGSAAAGKDAAGDGKGAKK